MSMPNKKRRRGRDLRPETTPTPGERLTKVRDPRASARFHFGDRVSWCDEEATYLGEDPDDAAYAIVRLPDGTLVKWPAALAGMRRIMRSDPNLVERLLGLSPESEEKPEELTCPEFGIKAEEDEDDSYYAEVEVSSDANKTYEDLSETLVGLGVEKR